MNQQVKSFWLTPRLTDFLKNGHHSYLRILGLLLLFGITTTASARKTNCDASAAFPGDTIISASICANETYLFNGLLLDMSGEYVALYMASDGTDSTVTLQLTVLPLSMDTITASICAGETYPFFGLALGASGAYDAVLTGSNGCDSTITLNLTVLPNATTNLSAGICSGAEYIFQGDTLTESGTYTAVLQAVNGCDSLVRLKLDVVDFFDVHLNAVICNGESYLFGDTILATSGVYVDSLLAIGGCDSIVTLELHILPPLESQLFIGICEGSAYLFHGDTLTTSGTYQTVVASYLGCDSLVILQLETVQLFEISLEATICDGETYTLGTQELTTDGVFKETLTAIGGCDSILTLTLTVLPNASGTDGATVCDGESYIYQGDTLSNPGVYEYVLESANGCDSVVTFTLVVLEAPNTVLEAVICNGATYFFYGETLDEEGVYEKIFGAANGCDSTISLILTVLPELITSLEAAICTGKTYDFNGEILDTTGTFTQVLVSEFGCDSTVTLSLTVFPLQSTILEQVICFNDSLDFNGVALTQSGTYTAVLPDIHGCDSTVTLHLEVLSELETNFGASICDGASFPFNGASLTTAGVYSVLLTGSYGCDSTVTVTLTVLPTFLTSIDVTICDGSPYNYFGQLLGNSGSYEFGFTGVNGCDSTVVINVTVLPLQYGSADVEICSGESYDYNGTSLTETGVYFFPFPGSNGCDSIFIVYLTVHPAFSTVLNVVECQGVSYEFNGISLVTSGSYIAEYTSIYGCDSTVTLNLNFVTLFESSFQATICAGDAFVFGTQTLTQSGQYQEVFSTSSGCDSVVTLSLTVIPVNNTALNVTICNGESYQYNGALLSVAGAYTASFIGANGCDSTIVLNLSVLPLSNSSIAATICDNESYAFGGSVLHVSGVYTEVFESANGCDSTVTLTLTVLPPVSSVVSATICAGETYNLNGQILNESGTYSTGYVAANGCDSIVTLALTVLPLPQSAFAATVCGGVPFEFNGEVFTTSGVYSFVLPDAALNGCDSVITLFLSIFPLIPPTNINATICAGESYEINGESFSQTGSFTFNLSSPTGCDSVVVLNLTVLPATGTAINGVLCNGESLTFGGQIITQPGVYTATFQDVNGCDSVVTLTLAVITVQVSVTQSNGVLTAASPNATFQWINCGNNQPIPGATSASYTPSITGQYAVIATNSTGCTAVSSCVSVVVTAVHELLAATGWALQPNPAESYTTVVLKEAFTQDVWLELFDSSGRLLLQQEVPASVEQFDLDISGYPDGILFVRLKGSGGVSSKRLMKGQ